MSLQNVVIGVVAVAALALAGLGFTKEMPLGAAPGPDHYVLETFNAGIAYRDEVASSTADRILTPSDSGKVFIVGTAGLDLTLPTPQKGLNYKVIVGSNFATTNMTVTGPASDATDDKIYGALEVAGAVVACSAEDTVSFVNTAELPGDFIELHSDGTNWYITGQATTAGGITCTDAD